MSYASQQFLVFSNATDADYQSWANAISASIRSMGWIQQNDTGQGVFAVTNMTLTQVTVGANAVYSYSSYTGPAPRVGMSVVFSGFLTGGNNVTATLTAVSGGASGTVTVALTTQANETHAGTGVTTLSTSPASASFNYEIWGPGDGGTTFYLKLEYGSSSGSPKGPRVRMSLSTTTNGAGTLTGFVTSVFEPSVSNLVGTANTNTYDSYFSGDTNRLGLLLWRGLTAGGGSNSGVPMIFVVERTHNVDGTDNADGVTIVVYAPSNNAVGQVGQQTLVMAIGVGNLTSPAGANVPNYNTPMSNARNVSDAFNGSIPVGPIFPNYGRFGPPLTSLAFVHSQDIAEGCYFTTTIYGAVRTFVVTWASQLNGVLNGSLRFAMRFD